MNSKGFITNIKGEIVTTSKSVNIAFSSKNVVLIGRNGSGKTSFLTSLYKVLTLNIISEQLLHLPGYRQALAVTEVRLAEDPGLINTIDQYRNFINSNTYPLDVSYVDGLKLIQDYKSGHAIIRFYEATRRISISKVQAATPLKTDRMLQATQSNLGVDLEQHLVNLKVNMALALLRDDKAKNAKIDEWFARFEDDLRYLFEDGSLRLEFNDEGLSFSLVQDGRPPYSFQSLSSGYLAIFDIYADLLVRAEYFNILPVDISGVVLIDEIDAHLHISIQRKILPFLTRSFPKVQFIVSTHSPFVISSTDDSLIYDLSTGKMCEDLSLFSLEHIVEAILGVPPISQKMQEKIAELVGLSASTEDNLESLESLLVELAPHVDTFDDESRMFYEISKNKYLVRKKGGSDV
ncbi:AAA family ATPase [Pseudomonas sp. NPDC012596]|uniref:AAA family ATPase n=1 Tax=Pseudomonas sp. NPDC012596 TaxID=3364419 RepID=UPI0036B81214